MSIVLMAVPHQSSAQDIVDESVVPFGIWGFIAPTTTFCLKVNTQSVCYTRTSQVYVGYRAGVTLRGPSDKNSRWLIPITIGYFCEYNVLKSPKLVRNTENREMLACAGFYDKFSGAFISLSGLELGMVQIGASISAGIYGDWKDRLKSARKGGAGMITVVYPMLFKRHGSRIGVIFEPSVGVGLHNYFPAGQCMVVFRPYISPK